jgi:hypothetical protein
MKKTSRKDSKVSASRAVATTRHEQKATADELQPHYDFDYTESRPNRFAARFEEGVVAVVLDPDVATVFQSSEVVNRFLRSAISAMPPRGTRKKKGAM